METQAKRLQMIAILSSALTGDEQQASMDLLARCLRGPIMHSEKRGSASTYHATELSPERAVYRSRSRAGLYVDGPQDAAFFKSLQSPPESSVRAESRSRGYSDSASSGSAGAVVWR